MLRNIARLLSFYIHESMMMAAGMASTSLAHERNQRKRERKKYKPSMDEEKTHPNKHTNTHISRFINARDDYLYGGQRSAHMRVNLFKGGLISFEFTQH